MSTSVRDFAGAVLLRASRHPEPLEETLEGVSVDLLEADGPCLAIQVVGSVSGTSPSMTGKIQESDDNSTWTDIANAVFTAVTASNNLQVIRFQRTRRYVRHYATVSGTSPVLLVSVMIGQQRKLL